MLNGMMAATCYFSMRFKDFFTNLVTHRSNLMAVLFYTWKVEFHAHGAPHMHGTLWLILKQLEMTALEDGKLKYFPEKNPKYEYTMTNLCQAFSNLHINLDQTEETLEGLTNFINHFITVTTHGPTVGKVSQQRTRRLTTWRMRWRKY